MEMTFGATALTSTAGLVSTVMRPRVGRCRSCTSTTSTLTERSAGFTLITLVSAPNFDSDPRAAATTDLGEPTVVLTVAVVAVVVVVVVLGLSAVLELPVAVELVLAGAVVGRSTGEVGVEEEAVALGSMESSERKVGGRNGIACLFSFVVDKLEFGKKSPLKSCCFLLEEVNKQVNTLSKGWNRCRV